MDNRDFWHYIRVASLPDFNPLLLHAPSPSTHVSSIDWLKRQIQQFFRRFYVRFYDLIFSTLFGYLTLHEELYIAVHQNNLRKARECLARGASSTYIPNNPRSIVKYLTRIDPYSRSYSIDRGVLASINACDSMLYMAVANNNFPLIKELVEHHNYGSNDHHTEVVSLCLAVKRGYDQIVEYLVDYGHIDPNDSVQIGCKHCKANFENSSRYQFPLYHACRENRLNIVKYLITTKNCHINQLTSTYETPLHGAILGAIENRFDTASNNQQRYHIVKYLLAQPDCNPNIGLNPVCVSLSHDNLYDYTSLLLQSNCLVDRLGWNYDERSNTVAHRSDCHLLYSLDHPLNICLQRLCPTSDNGHVADYHIQRRNAANLIEHRANIYAMSDFGSKYPFVLAVQTGDKVLVESMLKQATTDIRFDLIEPLIQACRRSYYDIVQILVDVGFNPNTIKYDFDTSKIKNPSSNELTGEEFLNYLNRYCTMTNPTIPLTIENSSTTFSTNYEQQRTPFLVLAQDPWIFHPDKYESTMKTIANLVSRQSIDFSIRANRLAFHHALLNEHVPLVYYCLAHFCPIDLLHSSIEFNSNHSKNHFTVTLFHLISLCCRLTERNCLKRTLFDAYAKHILRIFTYDRPTSMRNVLAYLKLWFQDVDFVYDSILFDHLVALPYIDDIFTEYGENYLRNYLGEHSSRLIDYQYQTKSIDSLKHLCRKRIRQDFQPSNHRSEKTNLLPLFQQSNFSLTNNLRCYLVYSRIRSRHLINHLVDGIAWNSIPWM